MKMLKDFSKILIGMVLTVVIFFSMNTVSGNTIRQKIDVLMGVKIVVDDVVLNPKDAKGNPVGVFIYNGTTYLPARAVSEAIGKPISYEGKEYTVYIGKRSNATNPVVLLKNMEYLSEAGGKLRKNDTMKDNFGTEYPNGGLMDYNSYSSSRTYFLNAMYTSFKGRVILPYDRRSIGEERAKQLKVYIDDRLVYTSPKMIAGSYPADFVIDTTGALVMKVEFAEGERGNAYSLGLVDAGLYQ
jgi:hypothetical protein